MNKMTDKHIDIPDELKQSMARLLSFGEAPEDQANLFLSQIELYKRIKTQSFNERELGKIRETISPIFFSLYKTIFKKMLPGNCNDRLYRMFITYAYMDEEILTPQQVNTLYSMLDGIKTPCGYPVHNLADWLKKIYSNEKDPSVNEFEQDYYEVFRELKRRGEMKDSDRASYENDVERRLSHEIDNLFRLGQRICCGQAAGYLPVLHSGIINKDLSSALLTGEKVINSFRRVLAVDFSAFHREIVYYRPELIANKELIMKQVFPDLILVPTFGARAVMWQEITGRVRNSPGRLLFPLFTAENPDDLAVDIMARFRWELSRTMSSSIQNNAHQNSLVAEYSDYIQFYKKNPELSGEAKEKLRVQIEKYRNNASDIFAADYSVWVNYESRGMLRLNKVARNILFKYCPFSKPIRQSLLKHPLYSPMITRYDNIRNKQLTLMEARYTKITRRGLNLDADLSGNLMFHRM
ncbi:hypothetical protein [Syntrophomonas curvata]